MLSPMEKLEALSRGYSLEELIEYEHLRGVASPKTLRQVSKKSTHTPLRSFLRIEIWRRSYAWPTPFKS